MNANDLTHLIRTSVGFDHLVHMMNAAMRAETQPESYPPYNIEKLDEDVYRITMAVAGFAEEDLQITVQDNTLYVSGKSKQEKSETTFLHRGIAARAFERHFQLADFIKIGEASLHNGLLNIELIREIPEAMKPRSIPISAKPTKGKLLNQKVEVS